MSFPDSLKGQQGTWFYYKDVPSASTRSGLPPYSSERVRAPPSLFVVKSEKAKVNILSTTLVSVMNAGVNGMDLLEAFLTQRIQPLQTMVHPMWMYEGPSDPTQVHPKELAEIDIGAKIKAITCARDNPRGTRRVPPYSKDLQPLEVCMRCSLGPCVNHFTCI